MRPTTPVPAPARLTRSSATCSASPARCWTGSTSIRPRGTRVPRLQHEELLGRPQGEASTVIRARVIQARAVQQERFAKEKGRLYANGAMQPAQIRKYCGVNGDVEELLRSAIQQLDA
jgi:magnesium chelatase subunit ChlI-like protein